MPIVLGLGTQIKDPLGIYGGGGLDPKPTESRIQPVETKTETRKPLADLPQKVVTQSSSFDEKDWNDIVDTVIAEAAGEGEKGMTAVAAVIKNRAMNRGVSPGSVVRQPSQFEGYENPREGSRKAQQDPEMRRKAERIVLGIFDGAVPDPTGGADHFHADYVSPDWATKMPLTTKIGGHSFYASSKQPEAAAQPAANQIAMGEGFELKDPMGFYGGSSNSADTVIETARLGAAQEGRVPGNPEAKGLARLMPPEKEIVAGGGGVLYFRHKGQDKIDDGFKSVLVDTSKALGRNFEITSGFRSPQHPVERRKKTPGEHARGTASDINMQGMSDQERAQLVTELRARGVKRFGTYTDSPDMLHVDMKDQAGNGSAWFMHDRTNRRLGKAPEWFHNAAAGEAPDPIESRAQLAVDTEFQTKDPMGIYRDGDPFRQEAQRGAAEEQAAAAAAEQEAQRAAVDAENGLVEAAGQNLDADNPGRYRVLDESDLAAWKEQWETDNRSGGVIGDTGRILDAGNARLGLKIRSAVGMIPKVGPSIVRGLDAVDEWVTGKPLEQRLKNYADRSDASVTPRQAVGDAKSWWDSERNTLGPAWSDPRSYLRAVGESLPGSVLTMGPSAVLARGAYIRALGAGQGERAAAAAASRTALLSGALGEGILGGAESAEAVRERIAAIPREQIAGTDTIRTMVAEGMSENEAIAALTGDAATQAFVISGVATGLFGGMGDRALAKILAEGVGGNIAKRILAGAARGAVGEGVLEELPQSAAQAVSENLAVRSADPNQSLTEGVAEAAAGGLAAGGTMGGGLGAAGGAASRADAVPGDIEPEQVVTPPVRRGPLTTALEHGEREAIRQQQSIRRSTLQNAAEAAAPAEARTNPAIGATVKVEAEGVDPFMARVDSYDGGEAIVIDGKTGEVYQVPLDAITQIAEPMTEIGQGGYAPPINDSIPDFSTDEALRPQDPIAGATVTEMPPRSEQTPVLERLSGAPKTGQRVIVDDPAVGRFPARVDSYEENATEVLVTGDDGRSIQVPIDRVFVSGLTDKQAEDQDLQRNPPVERDMPGLDEKSRRLGDKTVQLPDSLHARLYDLGKERLTTKRLMGLGKLGMDDALPATQRAIAKEFGVDPQALGQMADDYRYRVERAIKGSKSKLPVKMPPVNEKRLKDWQAEHRRAGTIEDAPSPIDEAAQWWDGMAPQARREILDQAGVKRSEKAAWKNHSAPIKAKLEAYRATAAGVDEANIAATSPANDLPEPTQAQKEAGNYKVGRVRLGGLDISVENPAGSERSGTDGGGKPWTVKMKSHYGYIRGTIGKDKDHIDVFVKPGTEELEGTAPVFVIDQHTPDRKFDEHKVMIGYATQEEAEMAYLENYTKDWELGPVGGTTLGQFKQWLKTGDTTLPTSALGNEHLFDHSGRFNRKGKSGQPSDNGADPDTVAHIHRTMADRVSPTEFARRVAQTKNSQESAVIEPGGKLLVLKATGNQFGDHAEFFGRLFETGNIPLEATGYIRLTGFGKHIGADASGKVSPAAEATLQAVKAAAIREGLVFTGEAAGKPTAANLPEVDQQQPAKTEPDKHGLTTAQVREVFRSKEFKAAYADIAATQMGTPHPESAVAFEMARGWLDQKAGRPPTRQKVPEHFGGVDPIEPYYMGYAAARDGKAVVIRASWQEDAYTNLTEPVDAPPTPPKTEKKAVDKPKAAEKAKLPVTANTVFTDDAAEKARALLRKKLSGSTLNSGIDPEIMQAGITLAGYHIEKGARTFAAFAQAMLADLGDVARPYLKSWYMGVKYDPRAGAFDGMSGAAEVDGADVDTIEAATGGESDGTAELDRVGAKALEGAPSGAVRGAEAGGQARRSAAGSGTADLFGDEPARGSRVSAGRGVADGAGDVSPAARGRKQRAAASVDDTADAAGNAVRPTLDVDRVEHPASAAVPAQQQPVNYHITADDALGEGGAKAKFNGNVKAIKLLRVLEQENRAATRDEQAVLAKWVGWGGLRPAFGRDDSTVNKGWEKEAAELKELLTPEEYRAAESSTRNAHYTSPEIVAAVWGIVRRLGFKGGQVLEPSVGAGNFLGMMPGEFGPSTKFTGVELDHITGGIAKNLYPSANIQAPIGFQNFVVPDGYFDMAIGNPPFGQERLYDKHRRALNKFSIHNFFFAKAVDALRPGGILAMVVTNRFLDGYSGAAREYIAERADLIGAIRLPNTAFLKNAGTEVTTDIVILQKRDGAKAGPAWTSVGEWTGKDGKAVPLNEYFAAHPDMMLGDFGAYGTMYGPDEPALVARAGDDIDKLMARAMRFLPEDVMFPPGTAVVEDPISVADTVETALVGSMFLSSDGTVHVRDNDLIGQAKSTPVVFSNDTAKERVSGMVRVRDAFAKLRRAQIDTSATDERLTNLRGRLNTLYDAFVKKHGPINTDANRRLFRDDPTWPQISALEEGFDKGISASVAAKTGEQALPPSASKAPIFTKRTQQPYKRPTSASSAKDALATTLADLGRVDLDAMSRLYGKTPDAIVSELGSLLFKTPSGAYETADHYLSGNVRQKIAEAERAVSENPDLHRNIAALRDVIPADIEAVDIDVKPGAPWIPPVYIEDFITHISESSVKPKAYWSKANAKWALDVPAASTAAQTQWATDRVAIGTILDNVMNAQTITVRDTHRDGTSTINQAATDAANEKAERVKAEWRRWLWTDDARRDTLARLYNDTFNTDRIRIFDGSHLSFPGKVGDDIISLRPHQKNFVWRAMQSSTTLADHTVGAGKTFALIAAAMEMRRTGQAKKPMFVVPNHLVGQWGADFVKLYPGAKVLAATKKDFDKENRKRLFARISTGDWDAVIVAHSSFGKIGVDPEFEKDFIEGQIADLEASMIELRQATGERSRNISQLTKWRDNMKSKLQRLVDSGGKDVGLTFEELGIDALFVDEAHEFKNLGFSTSMNRVAGLGNPAGSQKAADLYMKTLSVKKRTGGKNIVFATGTPLSNTMAEMYTVQRYFDGDALSALSVSHFDAWARVFGEIVTDWELSPSGQYRLNSRFAKFVNMPELMQRYLSFADVIANDDIKAQLAAIGKTLPLPKVKGGKPNNVVVERSADQAEYIGEGTMDEHGQLIFPKGSLVWRAENLPKKQEKGADNMLKVMSDARKAALDMRLIDPSYPDVPGSKVHVAADNIKRIYDGKTADRGTQLVFIDLSTPKKARVREEARIRDLIAKAEAGDDAAQTALDNMSPDEFDALNGAFSVYDDLKQKLLDRGIPETEVAFIHDANTDLQKEELFGKVRSGQVRVLFGSTPKMGAGTNVQNRLVALHHLDAPWRPSDLEQRDGRGIRQGNELYNQDPDGFEIEILRYATKNTLDARQWQTIEAKAKFIQQMRKGGLTTRQIEDIAGEAANAAEMKAAASGNPLILDEMDERRKLRRLEAQSVEHDREQYRIKQRISGMRDEVSKIEARADGVGADAAHAAELVDKPLAAQIGGVTIEKPKEFGETLVQTALKLKRDRETGEDVGSYGGFKVAVEHLHTDAFVVSLTGSRRHEVYISDLGNQDSVGLGMRVINTVKRAMTQPKEDAERRAELEQQIPALERQIAPWTGAEELEQSAQRHRELLDQLRPRPKPTPTTEDKEYSSADVEPVAVLTGQELGVDFRGGADMPALRTAAAKWYQENLFGTTAIMAGGEVVRFNRRGQKKTTYGGKGEQLLRAVPAIRPIIERGSVVYREPGNKPGIAERLIVSAPVDVGGRVLQLAVSVHKTDAGAFQYDFTFDRDAAPGPGARLSDDEFAIESEKRGTPRKTRGEDADASSGSLDASATSINLFLWNGEIKAKQTPAGWGDVDTSNDNPELTAADMEEIAGIVRRVSGISDVQWTKSIKLPNGAAGWGDDTPTTAGGFYSPGADVIAIAMDSASSRVAYHEAFHRLQNLFLNSKEKAVLAAEIGRLRAIVKTAMGREAQAARMSAKEVEAEAFAIYAAEREAGKVRPHVALRAAWDRIADTIRRVRNFLTGKGFQISEDIFDRAARGELATRPAQRPAGGAMENSISESRVIEEVGTRLTDMQPALLKAVPLNYFADLARPNMTAVGDYLRVKRSLDAYRGKKHAQADATAQEWLKYVRLGFLGKDKPRATALADLMHESTLTGVDPTKTDEETRAMPGYDDLRKQYLALPPAGRLLYSRVRDDYKQQVDELDGILLDNVRKSQQIALDRAEARFHEEVNRIERSGLSGKAKKQALDDATAAHKAQSTRAQWTMKARITKMRIAFESSRVSGPYFPLGRFGRHFVSVRDLNGEIIHFSKHETAGDRDRTAKTMLEDNPAASVQTGVMENGNELRQAMDPRILAEIDTILGGIDVDGTVMDQIWQRYLESMPDLSTRKRFIHRKGTAGFSKDALRVYSSHMFHAAHQMGRLKYGLELQELVNNAKDQAKKADDQTRAMTLANELANRHTWVMNPTGGKTAQVMTSTAFVWYLAASPAAAVVNMTQTMMLGVPILGARFGGVARAAAALARASRDSVSGRGSVRRANLKDDERKAIDAFYESGLIDRTQSHDIAGVGETGVEYSPVRAKVMATISWAFHHAEVWNREVTALAAYRMARDAGQSQSAAIDTAHDLTWKTHFDYSNSSRPALLQNDLAKVALVFRAHNINMIYRVVRDIHQATKGESAQIRKEARHQLAGVIGMMSLMAGVTGTIGFNLAMAVAGMLFGDDDDPMDFEQGFRKSVQDILGPELGGVVLNGVPGHYLGIDLTARIGMPDLWFRSPSRELQGRDEYQYWVSQILGATFGLGESWWAGFSIMKDEGNVARGLEVAAPKAIRDLLKAYRYSAEGVTSIRGDEILPADDVDVSDIIAQAIGFTPAKVSETWDRNTALKNAEKRILNKRRTLINSFATAVGMKDAEARNEAIQRIKAFNAVPINRPLAIKADTLKQSLKTRARNAAKREDGALIANPALGKKLRDALAEPIYR